MLPLTLLRESLRHREVPWFVDTSSLGSVVKGDAENAVLGQVTAALWIPHLEIPGEVLD